MSQHDKYFTFPIALLQLGKSLDDVTPSEAKTRVSEIMDWCLWEMNKHLAEKRTSEPSADVMLVDMASRHSNYPGAFDCDDEIDWLAAQKMFGIVHNVPCEQGKNLAEAIKNRVSMNAGKKLARVRSDILWSVIEGKMKWRDFAVLVAVNAVCFSEKKSAASGGVSKKNAAASVKFSQLRAMAIGYGSAKHCSDHNAAGLVLSEKAIGRTVAKLRQRGWFVKASPDNGRNTYYSNKMSEAQMIHYVVQIKVAKIQKQRSKRTPRQINQEVTARANVLAGLTTEERKKLQDVTNRLQSRRK
jgi:hypothetical protein